MTAKPLPPELAALAEALLADDPSRRHRPLRATTPGLPAIAPDSPKSIAPLAAFFFARHKVKLALAFALSPAEPSAKPALRVPDFARRIQARRASLLAPGDPKAWIDPFILDAFAFAPEGPVEKYPLFSWGLSQGLLSLLPERQAPSADAGHLLAGLSALEDLGWAATPLGLFHSSLPQGDHRRAIALREAFELARASEAARHHGFAAKGLRL
jgi:hypothetical protein